MIDLLLRQLKRSEAALKKNPSLSHSEAYTLAGLIAQAKLESDPTLSELLDLCVELELLIPESISKRQLTRKLTGQLRRTISLLTTDLVRRSVLKHPKASQPPIDRYAPDRLKPGFPPVGDSPEHP